MVTNFAKMMAMGKSTVVMADDGIGVKVEQATKFDGLERYLLCDCKATVYNGHYVVEGSAEQLYKIMVTIVTEYVPLVTVC